MCGICGIVRPEVSSVDPTTLRAMNAAIQHRGPDSDGFFEAPGVGLAMRRLAIIDLNTGDQPIANEDESLWIVFNGEIYNFPELRPALEKRGHHFHTQADTEAIVHLYEEYGPDCVQHLPEHCGWYAECLPDLWQHPCAPLEQDHWLLH